MLRTTLTIDDETMRLLKDMAHRSGLPLKAVVNKTLELGLEYLDKHSAKRSYRLKTYSLGIPATLNLDKALNHAASMEDDEILRKLEVRK